MSQYWLFDLIMTAVFAISALAFIFLGIKAAKQQEIMPKIICLLFTISCVMWTVDCLFATILNLTSGFYLTLHRWNSWVYWFCFPQAVLLLTYMFLMRMLSFERKTHGREKKEKLVTLISIVNAAYNLLFLFFLPIVRVIGIYFPEKSFYV